MPGRWYCCLHTAQSERENSRMTNRRSMKIGDWVNAAFILAGGVYLGLAIDSVFHLEGLLFWLGAISVPIIFGGIVFFGRMIDWLFDRMFPTGIKPSRRSRPKEPKPLALLFSLPTGILIGVIAAQVGLRELLL